MRAGMWLIVLGLGVAGVSPFLLQAQIFSDPCCGTCTLPVVQCVCQRTRPVVQTHLREEKVTTYRDVLETRYREECVVEHTPVTTYEDRVETVWVPQQVTKKVAKTVMVPQARSRTVPYQVMQRIPQTTTRVVPYQTVQHVTETYASAPVVAHAWIAPPVVLAPQMAILPQQAPQLSPTRSSLQTIPQRAATNDRYGDYEPARESPVPTPIGDEPIYRRSSSRSYAPAAAAAWNYNARALR